MYSQEDIARDLESLTLLMQESAEHGEMSSSIYADVLEVMGWLAALLRQGAAA